MAVTRIEVSVPGLLAEFTGGKRRVPIEADTVSGALAELLRCHPGLRPHLYDEAMRLRPHVLVFLNGTNTANLPKPDHRRGSTGEVQTRIRRNVLDGYCAGLNARLVLRRHHGMLAGRTELSS